MARPSTARYRPTARHFHNQPELQRGGFGLMLRWILYVWLASCGPLGNTVKQDVMDGTMFGTKSNYWDLNKSKFAVIDQLPLMGSVSPVLTVLAIYLIFVIKIGPAYMRKREAYKLTFALLAYNAVQVAISGYLVARFFLDLRRMGLVPSKCYLNEENSRNQIIFGTYLYLTAKFSELLDTVFFVLRKKYSQITFLHLYHHTVMVIATWALLKYWPSHTLIYIGFINSLVHVFMYSYYGLAALGPGVAKYLTWKKYMTKFQIDCLRRRNT